MTLARRLSALVSAFPTEEVATVSRSPEEWEAEATALSAYMRSSAHEQDVDAFTPPPPGWVTWEHSGAAGCPRCVAAAAARLQLLCVALASIETTDGRKGTVTLLPSEWRERGRWWPEADPWGDEECEPLGDALARLSAPPW